MVFKELTYVLALARNESITKAAQELYLTQPALTRFLQRLESSVGQPLFCRLGNRLVPTYAGEKYIERAQEILFLKKQLDEEMQDIAQNHRGQLRIGLSIFRSFSLLPKVLPAFTQRYPHVKLIIEEKDPPKLEESLIRGELDLAFFSLPVRRRELVTEIIRIEELMLLLPPQDPLINQAEPRPGCRYPWLDLSLLKDRLFILQKKDQRTRQITDQLFHDYNMTPNVILEIQNIDVSMALTAAGYGCSFTRNIHAVELQAYQPAPRCFSVGRERTLTHYAAAYRKGVYLPDYARGFIDLVRGQLSEKE